MRVLYGLLSLFFIFSVGASAQVVTISGHVADAANNAAMAGVSVQVGRQFGTVTNKDGNYSLTVAETILEKSGVRFSYVGYRDAVVRYRTGVRIFSAALEAAADSLEEVVISPKGLKLVRQAKEALEKNYPDKPFIITGVARTYNTINDTDYYYMNTAILESYFEPISDRREPKTRLVQTQDTLVRNALASKQAAHNLLRWLGAFHLSDFIYGDDDGIFDLEKIENQRYYYRRVEKLDGHVVHRIDFDGIKGFRRSGTVYLDTASLAFVGLDITVYNIARLGFVKTDVLVYQVRFEKRDNKWYLRSKDVNQKFEYSGRGQYIVAYHALSVNDEPTASFGYNETIQRLDENKTFQKPASAEAWQPFQKRIQQLEADDYLPVLATPYMAAAPATDSVGWPTGIRKPLWTRLLQYLDEGIHTLAGIQSAAAVPRYPGTGSVIPTDAIRVQLLIGYRFKLYKRLYAHAQFGGNFGIGGTRSSVGVTGLSYDFVLNKSHRPLVLAPLGGLHSQQLRNRGAGLSQMHRTWVAGLQWRIERNRRTAWFMQGLYHWPISNGSHRQPFSDFSSQPVRFSVGAGLFLR